METKILQRTSSRAEMKKKNENWAKERRDVKSLLLKIRKEYMP